MREEAGAEHRWLQQLVGEWKYEHRMSAEPGGPPESFSGTEVVRPLGELWVLAEGEGGMPGGGEATTVMTLGFDPRRGRFTGTFVASMMTHLWSYDGGLDADRRVLTLDTEGPSMSGDETLAPYRDVIRIEDDGRRTLTSYIRGDDGEWNEIMAATYRRTKKAAVGSGS